MAFTTLYLTATVAPYTPATIRGAWDDSAAMVTRALDAVKTRIAGNIATVAQAETNVSATWDVGLYRGVSGPLSAQTISGTVNVILGALESNAAADFYWHVHLYVTQGNSDTPRGTLLTNYIENTTNEWPTTAAGIALQSAQTLSSLAISAGDRLVAEIGFIARNAVTTSRTGTLWYGTDVLTAAVGDLTVAGAEDALAGHLIFSNSITEDVIAARASQVTLEALSDGTAGDARASQVVVEALSAGTAGDVRASAVYLEVLAPLAAAALRASAVYLEVLSLPGSSVFVVPLVNGGLVNAGLVRRLAA